MLDEELKKAAADDDVIAAIAGKISRERVGHEVYFNTHLLLLIRSPELKLHYCLSSRITQIDLMMSGNEPLKAMLHISELQLFWAVFSLPLKAEPPIPEGCER